MGSKKNPHPGDWFCFKTLGSHSQTALLGVRDILGLDKLPVSSLGHPGPDSPSLVYACMEDLAPWKHREANHLLFSGSVL